MTVARRTISLPIDLARRLDRLAKRERVSFSAAVSDLIEDALRRRESPPLTFIGAMDDGPEDLSLRIEEYVGRWAEDWPAND